MKHGALGLKPVLHRKRIIDVCLVTVFILALLPFAHGAEEDSLPWKISADQITHQREPEKIIAEGKVLLQQYKEDTPTGLELEADRIQYNVDVNSVDAVGNLHLRDHYDEVRASEAQINLEKQIGFFKEATIFWQDTNLSASAELIEKTDLKSYHFVNGKLTTCPPEDDKAAAWSIWGRDVEITLDDYAKLKHATFRIKDVPVFYLPYLRIPIRTDKKSGLLFPEYSSSDRNGIGIIAPVFFNLSPSYDMTLYPGYYSDRGPLIAGEFRYIADFNSRGTFMVNYLDDELEDTPENDFKSDGYLRTNSKRYWIRGKADHDFGNRLVAKLDIDLVSDRDYLQEFKKGIIGFDKSNSDFLALYNRGFQAETVDRRENTLQLSKVWTTTDLQSEINIIDDLRDAPDEVTPPWALPRIAYSGLLPFLQTPLDLTWGTEYVNYWRDEGVGAHRLDLFPQLNGPISFTPYLESSYLLGLRETLYFIQPHDTQSEEIWGDRDFEHRTFYNILLTGATTLSRDYDLSMKRYKTFRHAMRPELSYILVKGTGQEDLPILDNEDRLQEKNWVQYGFNNYFRAIRPHETALFSNNFSSFKINQVYDIDAEENPFSDLYFEFIVRGWQDLYLRYETTLSMYDEGVTTYSLEARYKNRRGDRLNIDYRYKLHPDIEPPYFYTEAAGESLHEIRANVESRLSRLFSVKYDATYSLSSNSTVDSTFSLVYHNPCWTLEFAASRNIGDNSFYLLFSLAGIGTPLDFGLPEF
jgi:LPS-assembly protein